MSTLEKCRMNSNSAIINTNGGREHFTIHFSSNEMIPYMKILIAFTFSISCLVSVNASKIEQ